MNNKIQEVSNTSLLQAKRYADVGNFGRAFAHYLVYLELCKDNRVLIENEFIDTLLKWLDILKSHERNDNILSCLQSALEYFPYNCIILTVLARYLTSWNQHKVASNFLKLALRENEDYLPAIKLHNYINNVLLERWHIRMLNDKIRNESFQKAIHRKISQGYNNILDIGTGTGLLSLYAANSTCPVQITACDSSSTMIELAKEIVDANHCTVNLIEKRSSDINVTKKFNLIVTEIFDSGVFGEGAVETLIHAWDNLLDCKGKIIPAGVELHVAGIQCPELVRKHSVCTDEINELNFESIRIVNMDHDPYETEDLYCFKDFKYIANTSTPWLVNFHDLVQLKNILNGGTHALELECCEKGDINAFAVWFSLHLDEDIKITNRPCKTNRNCCWEQAIFHLDQPIKVISGQSLSISLIYNDGKLKIDTNLDTESIYRVPCAVVRFLNDYQCFKAISNVALNWDKHAVQINILDLSPFPLLGLLLLKTRQGSLTCCAKIDSEKYLIRKLCEINNIKCKLTFIEDPMDCKSDKFDVIYLNVLETEGELNQNIWLHMTSLKRSLKQNGVFLPNSITLYGAVVESDWIKRVVWVDDQNVSNFRIAEFIHKYENNEQVDFTLRHLDHKNLIEPCEFLCLDLDQSRNDIVSKLVHMNVKDAGEANAICYWFEINLMGYKHSTGPENSCAYVNNAAFLLPNGLNLIEDDRIYLRIIEHDGLLKVSTEKHLQEQAVTGHSE